NVPPGRVEFLSLMHERDVPYVYLARPVNREHGQKSWEPCFDNDMFFRDWDGLLNFGLGLAIVAPSMAPYALHVAITIDDVTSDTITLVIVNAPGKIKVQIDKPDSYGIAAKAIGEWLLALQSDPRAALGDKSPIGFGGGK